MNQKHLHVLYHLMAIMVIMIWGVTFVNTKVLLGHGMDAAEIFVLRFVMGYALIWMMNDGGQTLPNGRRLRRKLFADSWRDEGILVLISITGGSLYFMMENLAVKYSLTNNVSFIVCTAPLWTIMLGMAVFRDVKATPRLLSGSAAALLGMALIIFNGQFVMHLNPLGDMLALAAALNWAVYSLLMRNIAKRYSAVFVTRKLFFYGLLTILPYFAFYPWQFPLSRLSEATVMGNLLFLGVLASFVGYALWSLSIKKIGAISASNYVYLNPIATVVASAIFLNEPMTLMAYAGLALILLGVYFANTHTSE